MAVRICAALAIITATIFWPVRQFEFVNYDDTDYVSQNEIVLKGLSWPNVKWAFTTGHASNWHPITWISHMLDAQLFGSMPAGHHQTNLLFHVANSVLLFLLLRRMTQATWRSTVVAALFALHPLHVESVAWVSERKDVLSTFLMLVTLWSYERHVQEQGARSQKTEMRSHNQKAPPVFCFLNSRFYFVSLFLFALGLMAKPMLVTLPCVLLLLDFWPLGRLTSAKEPLAGTASRQLDVRRLTMLVFEKVPFFLLTIGSCVVTYFAQKNYGAVFATEHFPIGSRVANALVSYLRYIEKLFWPHDLAVPYPLPDHWPVWLAGLAVVFLTVVSALCFRARHYKPYLLVGWLWYLGTLVPVIGIVQVGMQSMADRYTYVPFIGLFILLVWGIADLATKFQIPRYAVAATTAAVLGTCSIVTLRQLPHWRNTITLFTHTLSVTTGNFMVHYNLGNKYSALGRNDEAVEQYRAALRIRPDYGNAHNNLGTVLDTMGRHEEAAREYALALNSSKSDASYINVGNAAMRAGKFEEAIANYREALKANPRSPQAHHNLGFAYMQQRDVGGAVAEFQTALRLAPNYTDAHHNLGVALLRQGKAAAAVESFSTALQLEPGRFESHRYLATALTDIGRIGDAIPHFTKAVELRPDDADLRGSFGVALAQQGKMDDAIQQLQQAIRLDPKLAGAYGNLGNALASQGRIDEALEQYRKGLELSPNDEQLHSNFATALAQQGRLQESIGHFTTALKLAPDNIQTRFNFALILLRSGQKDSAITEFREILRLQPGFTAAKDQLSALGVQP